MMTDAWTHAANHVDCAHGGATRHRSHPRNTTPRRCQSCHTQSQHAGHGVLLVTEVEHPRVEHAIAVAQEDGGEEEGEREELVPVPQARLGREHALGTEPQHGHCGAVDHDGLVLEKSASIAVRGDQRPQNKSQTPTATACRGTGGLVHVCDRAFRSSQLPYTPLATPPPPEGSKARGQYALPQANRANHQGLVPPQLPPPPQKVQRQEANRCCHRLTEPTPRPCAPATPPPPPEGSKARGQYALPQANRANHQGPVPPQLPPPPPRKVQRQEANRRCHRLIEPTTKALCPPPPPRRFKGKRPICVATG